MKRLILAALLALASVPAIAQSLPTPNVAGLKVGGTAQTFPTSGNLVGTTDTQTLSGKAISGSSNTLTNIGNSSLTNSSVTVAGHNVSLGTSTSVACGDLSNGATGCSTATGTSGATIPLLNGANTWSGVQSIGSGDLALKGSTSGTLTVKPAATAGTSTLTLPGGTTDFSSTGGTSEVVKQASAGAALTVGTLACSDLSNDAASCSTDTTNAANISSGTLPAARMPALTGDATTTSGAVATTVGKVNGVTYSASPSTNTVPVVTGSNATTYEAVPNAALANAATTVNGQTCTLGSTCTVTAAASGMTVGTTTITSGTSGNLQYNNVGVLGERSLTATLDTLGSTQGQVLYRGASGWTVLPPGTSGQVLTTGGAAANPSWTSAGGSGSVTSVTCGTGLSGGTITSSGTCSLSTPVSVANGGTGSNALPVALIGPCDGTTDLTSTINAALSALTGKGGELRFQAGTCLVNSQISYSYPATARFSVSFVGSGPNATTIDFPSTSGFAITANLPSQTVHFRDMGIVSGTAGTKFGLILTNSAYEGDVQPSDITHVYMAGDDEVNAGTGVHYWSIATTITNWSDFNFAGDTFYGIFHSGAPLGFGLDVLSNGTGTTQLAYYYNLQGCTFIWNSVALIMGSQTQGITVNSSQFTNNGVAISVPGSQTNNSLLVVTNSQFDNYGNQIQAVSNIASIFLNGNIFYVKASSSGLTAAAGQQHTIIGNVFDCLACSGSSGSTGVLFSGATVNSTITGNVFTNLQTGYSLASGTTLDVTSQNSFSSVTTHDVNSGTGNIVGTATP